jgi:hypothetical protein
MEVIKFTDIKNERMSRCILGVVFSADMETYIEPGGGHIPKDALTGEPLTYQDLDGWGLIRIFDWIEEESLVKVSTLMGLGFKGIKRMEDEGLQDLIYSCDIV